ncbi:hypothetical protein OWM07_08365 [Deferribacter thermophilus]|uniref:hypothetical protein n=1 Tax=Deferribacter thermophilus TaxID=53573 RepID=UPI003C1F9B31
MIVYSRLILFLLISLIFHFALIFVIPELHIDFKKLREQDVEVFIVKKSYVSKVLEKKNRDNLIENANLNKIKEKIKGFKKKRSNIKSNVDLPEASNLEKINIPQLNEIKIKDIEKKDDVNLESELNVVKEEALKEYSLTNEQIAQSKANSFYEIKKISNIKRKIIYEPPKPSFQLEKDTKITLKFKVDRYGIPYDINFVTRSSSYVENLAVKFIKELRFDAVDYTQADEVEIVLYFRVE